MTQILDTFLNLFYYIIPFIIVICVLVFVHELGHYLAARYFGVKVESFSIGMGKEIWGKTDKHGTRWKLSAIPVGGYVMMYGDKDPSSTPDAEDIKKMTEKEKSLSLQGKKPWQRIIVSFAGPFANIIYAFVAVMFVYLAFGRIENTSVVDTVVPDTPAYHTGILSGDKITSINGTAVNSAVEAMKCIQEADAGVNIVFKRGDEERSFNIQFENPTKKVIGVTFKREYKRDGLLEALSRSFSDTCLFVKGVFLGMIRIFTGGVSLKQFGGPVAIAGVFGDISKTGDIAYLIFFSAILSINLAIFNLIPLPALDGGNIFVDFIEILINRPVSLRLKEIWNTVGIGFLIFLMLFATYSDILKISVVRKLLSVFGW